MSELTDPEEVYYQLRRLVEQAFGNEAADAADESLSDATYLMCGEEPS